MNNFKVHELWPIPIYENYIPVKSEWINFAENCKYDRMFSENGDYTVDKYILDNVIDLKNELFFHVNLFAEKYLKIVNTQFYFLNSWIVKHRPNDWAQAHHHINSLLSGVYYLKTEKNNGDINFIKDPKDQNIFPLAITPNYGEYNQSNSKYYKFEPKVGNLIIFPSTLMHEVTINKSNNIRYSLAFNVFCKGIFGKNEYELKL
jgi:uncharacterized protein (TIGR02466 family)